MSGSPALEVKNKEASTSSAKVLAGGNRDETPYYPAVLVDVKPEMNVIPEKAFALVVSVISCDDFEESIRQANNTKFGLQVGVFTKDIDRVLEALKRLNFGGVIINDISNFRTDNIPYGGNLRAVRVLRESVLRWKI